MSDETNTTHEHNHIILTVLITTPPRYSNTYGNGQF
jgi:hypothetical protein